MSRQTQGDAPSILVGDRPIGENYSVYVVAELSANHHGDFDRAAAIVRAAAAAGADAVKLQTYTADTLTLKYDTEPFRIQSGTAWDGQTLHELYSKAAMPWEWHADLMALAQECGLHCFSTPYDDSAVDFLEQLDVPAYKIASFELVDLPLLVRVAATSKPIILSTGMASLPEIEEAVTTLRGAGAKEFMLLKATSAYPAPPEEMNVRGVRLLSRRFCVPVGLSDHTLDSVAACVAVAHGACLIEKHLTLSRQVPGPDSSFSLEPGEFAQLVEDVQTAQRCLGREEWRLGPKEMASLPFRRSLFVARDVRAGEDFTAENVRSIRPASGLHTRHYAEILQCRAARDLRAGTPLTWDDVERT